jgi:hypothetical protein
MSTGNSTPEKEEILGIPYLSPTLNKESPSGNHGNHPEPTKSNREDTEKIKDYKKKENIEKNKKKEDNKKNINNEKNKKKGEDVSSGIPVQESSSSNMGLGINKRRAGDAVEASTSKSIEALNLPNSEYLEEHQKESLILFLQNSRKIECEHCNSLGKINITRIDELEIGEVHCADIIFTCRECKKKTKESKVQAQLLSKTKIKKRQVIENEELEDVIIVEDKIMEETEIESSSMASKQLEIEEEFEVNRRQLKCTQCESVGTINKNGHNQSKPPQRQYKCKNCSKSICLSEMKILLKYLINDSVMTENEVDYSDNDFPDTDDENVIEEDMETEDDEVELVMDVRSEILMLKKRLNKTEKETKKYNELMKECINLKKENIELKKVIKELKKGKEEQKNSKKEIEKKSDKKIETEKKSSKKGKERESDNKNKKDTIEKNNLYYSLQQQTNNIQNNNNIPEPLSETEYPKLQPAATMQQQPKITWPKRQRNQFFRHNNPSKKQMELATRTFEEKIEESNYINVYLPSKRRMKPSEIRKKLSFIGIDNLQILDTYSPDWDTVLLLIHEKYKEALVLKLEKAGIMLKEYNYLHVSHLRDSRLTGLTIDEKVEKLKLIRNNCSMRALQFIRDPVKKSVARCFHRQQIITDQQLKQVLTGSNVEEARRAFTERVIPNEESEAMEVIIEEEGKKIGEEEVFSLGATQTEPTNNI